jgi:ABC-type phosphate transport system permease subunit
MSISDTWFEAEAVVKKIRDHSPDYFKTLMKLLATIILFALCVIIFVVLLSSQFVVAMFEKFKKKEEKPMETWDNEYEQHSDYSNVPEVIEKEARKDLDAKLREKGML